MGHCPGTKIDADSKDDVKAAYASVGRSSYGLLPFNHDN